MNWSIRNVLAAKVAIEMLIKSDKRYPSDSLKYRFYKAIGIEVL